MLITKPVWGVLEYDLAAAMYAGLKSYWARVRTRRKAGEEFMTPPPEVSLAPADESVFMAHMQY